MENSDVKPTLGFIPMQASPLQMNSGPGDMSIHETNLSSLQVPFHSTPPVQSTNVMMDPSESLYSGRKHAFNPVISNPHVKRMKEAGSGPLQSSLPGHSMDSSFRAPSPVYFQENVQQQFRPQVQMSSPSMPFEKRSQAVQKSVPGSAFQIPRTGGTQSVEDTQRLNSFQDPGFAARKEAVRAWGNQPLSVADPDLWDIMEKEKNRQWKGIELIASENFTSQAVIEALGSHLTNKYSEGMPGARYYGGNEYIDEIETLCWERALAAFDLDQEKWGVNVQCYSCTSANFAVYTALLQPKDRIMGLDSPSGGHLSHGYYTCSGKKVSAASIFYESLPYKVNPKTGYIDYDKLEEKALEFRPKILICGGSAYPREWDYDRFRKIADKCGAVLMCDMAHISGLIATKECRSPFDFCDIVTSTTHKSLRGPRGGMIFYRKGPKPRKKDSNETEVYDLEEKINFAVFPSLQGGPHNNHIAALAVALKQVNSPEYKDYIKQVEKNAQTLANALLRRKCKLVTDGTDNHLMLWDLRPLGLTGNRYEKVCEMCHMTLNKNAVFGDSTSYAPGGVRIGTPAMTSRGCIESDFEVIAEFLYKAAQIARRVQKEHGKHQKEFLKGLRNNKDVLDLRSEVEKFASAFGVPGFDLAAMKYNR